MAEQIRPVSRAGGEIGYGTIVTATSEAHDQMKTTTSNEYVLNVAFGSFSLFTAMQFFFALAANSHAMMADCAAMTVDAITYLVNYGAERMKNCKNSENDLELHPEARQRHQKLQRLYLELVPPLVSVTTLLVVTFVSVKDAIDELMDDGTDSKPPDVLIMLVFSSLNLILDVVNVSCFARAADQIVGLPTSLQVNVNENGSDEETELAGMLKKGNNTGDSLTYSGVSQETDVDSGSSGLNDDDDDDSRSSGNNNLNLNMCSAWTHICADTLRSITTLLAASFSWCFPEILSPAAADSWGAIFISVIIIVSLSPLIQGIFATAGEICDFHCRRETF